MCKNLICNLPGQFIRCGAKLGVALATALVAAIPLLCVYSTTNAQTATPTVTPTRANTPAQQTPAPTAQSSGTLTQTSAALADQFTGSVFVPAAVNIRRVAGIHGMKEPTSKRTPDNIFLATGKTTEKDGYTWHEIWLADNSVGWVADISGVRISDEVPDTLLARAAQGTPTPRPAMPTATPIFVPGSTPVQFSEMLVKDESGVVMDLANLPLLGAVWPDTPQVSVYISRTLDMTKEEASTGTKTQVYAGAIGDLEGKTVDLLTDEEWEYLADSYKSAFAEYKPNHEYKLLPPDQISQLYIVEIYGTDQQIRREIPRELTVKLPLATAMGIHHVYHLYHFTNMDDDGLNMVFYQDRDDGTKSVLVVLMTSRQPKQLPENLQKYAGISLFTRGLMHASGFFGFPAGTMSPGGTLEYARAFSDFHNTMYELLDPAFDTITGN